mgnify:CR=1
MVKFFEHTKRSIAKTITYRILITISTFIVMYFMTGNLSLTLGVTLVSNIVSTFLYFLHERIWNQIHWGKIK